MRSLSYLSLAFLSAFLLLAATPLAAAWHFLPTGTPPFNFVTDSSGQRILLYSYWPGVWRTSNGGQSWDEITDRFAPYSGFDRLHHWVSADPRADTVIVHSYETGTVFSTSNGGTTWQPLPLRQDVGLVSHAHRDIWFSSLCGLCTSPMRFTRSYDRGATWPDTIQINELGESQFRVADWYQDPFRDSTLFAIFTDLCASGGLFRSSDLGSSWTFCLPIVNHLGPTGIAALSNDSILVFLTDLDRFDRTVTLLSIDHGVTWDTLSSLRQFGLISTIIEDRFHPGHLLMATDYPVRLLRSDDFGATWNPTGSGVPAGVDQAQSLTQDYFSGMLTLAAGGIFTSHDFGETWTAVPRSAFGIQGSVAVTPEAVFLDRSELQSPFDHWQPITLPASNADTLVTSSPMLYKHSDTLVVATLARNQSTAENVPGFSTYRMAYSFDAGSTWSFGPGQIPRLDLNSIKSVYSNGRARMIAHRGYVGDNGPDTLYLSDDLGMTWQPSLIAPGLPVKDYVTSGSDVYVATQTVMHSGDDGLTWQPLGDQYANQLILAGGRILARYSHNLYTWQDTSWVLRSVCPGLEIVAVNAQPLLLVATYPSKDTVFVSADTGLTWEARHYDPPTSERVEGLSHLVYDPYRERIWASTAVGTVYLNVSDLAAGEQPKQFHPSDFSLLSIYPNPFNSEARINYDLEMRGQVRLDLFNLEGRVVRTLADGIQEGGRHEIRFSGEGLASGIYFVRLATPLRTRTEKIVLLK
jgi:photosystem II stability/assembly factor-like uncharacterized protein